MQEIVRYDAMCYAIAECHRVDECRELENKARALELYAKQSKNTDAERKACEIRLRAEIRTGELLKELARATVPNPQGVGGHGGKVVAPLAGGQQAQSPYAQALTDNNISSQSASRYQALADVPKDVVEAAFRDPVDTPTTRGLIEAARGPAPKMPADSLWLWGRLRDLERDGFFNKQVSVLLEPMTETMRADVARLAPLAAAFFNQFDEVLNEFA